VNSERGTGNVEQLELLFVGFGNVARRAIRLLDEMRGRLPFEWTAIAVVTARHGAARDVRGLDPAALLETVESGRSLGGDRISDAAAWLREVCRLRADVARDGRLVCVETTVLDIRAGEPATSHVRAALQAGAHVVTANKGPAAFSYQALAALARGRERQFLFEGAVMDGIPVLNLVRDTLPGVRIEGFRGVINSTTNHILSALERGEPFETALSRMQAEGIAEADPTLDVDGWDAAAKTAVLMNVLMGAQVTPHEIEREGIRGVSGDAVRAAADRGERVRLVASADRSAGFARGRVRLEHVAAEDPLGSLEGQQNALLLRTDLLGEIGILQRDGGLTQTAYAIVSDLATIARSAAGANAATTRRVQGAT
jgi:homoserine dehydrogenase